MEKNAGLLTKILSVFLSVILIIGIVPMQVFAIGTKEISEIVHESTDIENDEVEILYEVEESRDKYTKVYKKSDGTYTAMVSLEPLHFMQDGKWTDIDNTLISAEKNGKSVLTNKNGIIDVFFPEMLSDKTEISIENDGYSLSFVLQDIKESEVEISENTEAFSSTESSNQQIGEDIKTQSESAVYENVMRETDIEYSVSSDKIKENIIINKPSAVNDRYDFNISAKGLSGVIGNDNSVSFFNNEGEKIFYIPAPFMKDSTNSFSLNIDIELTDSGNGEYVLTYLPDTQWLKSDDRVYPIVIDPIIGLESNPWLEHAAVSFESPDDNYYNEAALLVYNGLYYEHDSDELVYEGGTVESYIKLNLDQIGLFMDGITPVDVQLVLSGAASNVAAYEILSECDIGTVTYNTKPQIGTNVIDYYAGKMDYDDLEIIHFNITKILYEWLSGEKKNNGIALLGYDNTVPAVGLFLNYGLDSNITFLFIDYVETSGYNDIYDYHTQDVGRAGTSYINDFTQRLFIKRDDIGISGNIMPVNVSFMYNPAQVVIAEKLNLFSQLENGTELVIPEVYGNHWLTNYNRVLYVNEYASELIPTLSYLTENGSVINFTAEEQDDGTIVFVEENADITGGSGYSIVYDENSIDDLGDIKIINTNGETEEFDDQGRLVKIYKEKYPNQSIDIVYVSDCSSDNNIFAIDYITDGVGRKYDFKYNSETGLLSDIDCLGANGKAIKAGSTSLTNLDMSYSYDENGNLKKVTFPDGGQASYGYDSTGKMISAVSRNAYKLLYSYDSYGRVTSVTEYAQDEKLLSGYKMGNRITIKPNGPKQVTFSDSNGAYETKQFDKYGMTSLVTDEKGNYIDSTLGIVRTTSKNLLSNQNFKKGFDKWETRSKFGTHFNEENFQLIETSLKLSSDSISNNYITQTVPVTESGSYTFSAYIKAENELSGNEKIVLKCVAVDADGKTVSDNSRTVAAVSTNFNRYSVSLNVPDNAVEVVVSIGFFGTTGEFYIDRTQFEKGSGSGEYNQLSNSAFTDTSKGLVVDWQSASPYTVATETVNTALSKTISFAPSVNANHSLSQTVEINGTAGDMISFGGWVKADVVSNGSDHLLAKLAPDETDFRGDRFAGFTITYSYTTEENGKQVTKTETVKKEINDFINDWQFVSDYVILEGDCISVEFKFEYANHPSAVSVAMPQLSIGKGIELEEFEDEDIDTALPETPEELDSCVCGESCDYGYGCPCDCASAGECDCDECKGCLCSDCTNPECDCTCGSEYVCACEQCGKLFDIQYDEHGNLLSVKIMGKDVSQYLSMFTARTFSSDGNYMTSSTNENGNIVRYNYNKLNGMLDSVTDARGNTTEYTYNAMGALTQVKTPVSGLAKEGLGLIQPKAMTTNYSYLNDRVVRIQHNDFAYYIDYDEWGNVDKVYTDAANAVLGVVSADYTYSDGENHSRLDGVRYGNGGTVQYRYDEYDRVTGISYDGGESWRFEYGYDTVGNITYIYDHDTGNVSFYNENSLEIYRNDNLLYYAGYDDDGAFFEYEGGMVVYKTQELESIKDLETGFTTNNTQVSAELSQVNVLKTTDAFSRTKQKAIQLHNLEQTENTSYASVVTDYTYKTYGENNSFVGGQVDTLTSRVTYGDSMSAENTVKEYGLAYEYDENGNITHEYSVNSNGTKTLRYRYTYDEANQMTRVDDNVQSKTYVYQYDKGGNRVSEKIYKYTLSNSLGAVQKTVKSEYKYITWNDRLSKYDGKTISYDNAGNPTSYDGKTFVWDGKQLKAIKAADGSRTTFDYDADGLRTRKTQYDEEGKKLYYVDYVWSDGKILTQYITLMVYTTYKGVTTVSELGPIPSKIIYDDSDTPQGFIFADGAQFAFVRNLQGDVIAMVDQDGQVAVEYTYDPWGNIEYKLDESYFTTEEDALIFTALCPLTYRGYNYDFTTGLYYLQSRYYNPEWGRFLNCDDTVILLATKGKALGANMFAYCGNNPVNRIDPTGFKGKKYSDGELLLFAFIALETVYIMEMISGKSYMDKDIIAFDYVIEKHGLIISKIAHETGRDSKYEKYQVSEVVYGLLNDWESYTKNEKEVYTKKAQYDIWVADTNFGMAELESWHNFGLEDGDPYETNYRAVNIALTALFYGYPLFDAYYNGEKWKPYTWFYKKGIDRNAEGMGFLYAPIYTREKYLKSNMKLKEKKEKVPSYDNAIGHAFF